LLVELRSKTLHKLKAGITKELEEGMRNQGPMMTAVASPHDLDKLGLNCFVIVVRTLHQSHLPGPTWEYPKLPGAEI
jgi:hypothetical protein